MIIRWSCRLFWIGVIIAGLTWPITNGIRDLHHEHRVKEMLLNVQNALQKYHVEQERYIPRQELKGSEIIAVLVDFEHIKETPINPWSKEPWKLDGNEPDFLRYHTDANFETYSLKALDPETGEVFMEIDSVKHQSLDEASQR